MPTVTTSDGVSLNYVDKGKGRPLVMIPGWSQSAAQFQAQVDGLSDRYRVIALDMRGHGLSEKVNHGYKIQRLAKDVHDVLEALGLDGVALLGHSMGCSVIWCYYDLFGRERLERLVLVDQMPFITSNPTWTEQQRADFGPILDGTTLYDTYNALSGPAGVETSKGFVGGMFTKAWPAEKLAWVIEENLRLPRQHAADLLFNHAMQDWRDVIPRIDLPTLVVGGKTSLVGWRSQLWIASQIKGAKVEIFEDADGGAHFMFMENPGKFNALVADFLG